MAKTGKPYGTLETSESFPKFITGGADNTIVKKIMAIHGKRD